ncbi:MAG: hypothetical protein ACLFVS_06610 [Candidatus Acetothermia bacterium]
MRKLSLFLLIAFLVFLVSGCSYIETETLFSVDEEGMMDIEINLRADESMAGNQARTFIWGLVNSIPELQNNYKIEQEIKKIDYSDYLFYRISSIDKISVDKHEYITFSSKSGGGNRFEMTIPALLKEVSESDKDNRAFTISVTLPGEIDMSNSRKVEGNTAEWVIYYHELTSETDLKAITS